MAEGEEHYLQSVVEGDLSATFARWNASERESPVEAVIRAGAAWPAMKAPLEESGDPEARTACQREWLAALLNGLGYTWQPEVYSSEEALPFPWRAK